MLITVSANYAADRGNRMINAAINRRIAQCSIADRTGIVSRYPAGFCWHQRDTGTAIGAGNSSATHCRQVNQCVTAVVVTNNAAD